MWSDGAGEAVKKKKRLNQIILNVISLVSACIDIFLIKQYP